MIELKRRLAIVFNNAIPIQDMKLVKYEDQVVCENEKTIRELRYSNPINTTAEMLDRQKNQEESLTTCILTHC